MKTARLLLIAFFFLAFLHVCRRAFISYVGVDTKFYFGLLSLPVLLLATFKYQSALGPPPTRSGYRTHMMALAVVVVLLAIYGYLRGNLLNYILLDTGVWIAILCFLYLGQYSQVWSDVEKPICVVTLLGLALIVVSLGRPEVTISFDEGIEVGELDTKGRYTVGTLGYSLKSLLQLAPLLFAMAYTRPKWDWVKISAVVSIVGMLGLQLYFQKRGPTVRELSYIFMVVIVVPMFHKKLSITTVALLVVGGVIALAAVGSEHIIALFQRYAASGPFLQNERWYEASYFLSDINAAEFVAGRGMGGYYMPPPHWGAGVVPVNYDGTLGRISLHVGMLWPMLKGGLLLAGLYYAFFFRMFKPKGKAWYLHRFNSAAIAIIPVYWVYQLIGGPPSMTAIYDAVVVGLCCARLAVPAPVVVTVPQVQTSYQQPGHHPRPNMAGY